MTKNSLDTWQQSYYSGLDLLNDCIICYSCYFLSPWLYIFEAL